jgi:hypothetical protein
MRFDTGCASAPVAARAMHELYACGKECAMNFVNYSVLPRPRRLAPPTPSLLHVLRVAIQRRVEALAARKCAGLARRTTPVPYY